MSVRGSLLSGLLLILAAPSMGAAAADPATTPASPESAPDVWLKGAFGRVLGSSPAAPAAAPPSGAPLDAFVRQAPLTLETDVPQQDLLDVTVVSRLLPRGTDVSLSDGASPFQGPEAVGTHVITASVTTAGHGDSRHAWLVSVPDRAWSEDVLFEITPPEIRLVSDADEMVGIPGNGCYAYLCSDIGGVPLPPTKEPLQVAIGETLSVRTGDGSALAGWSGRLKRLDDSTGKLTEASGASTEGMESMVLLPGLEASSAGRWLLEVRVDFDRERGWQWHGYHLLAE